MTVDLEFQRRGLALALERGDYKLVDRAARTLLRDHPGEGWLYAVLADLAERLGRQWWRDRFLEQAAEMGSPMPASSMAVSRSSASAGEYLLATEWGYGFWADVNHVIGSLLIAEMTGRTPTVRWSDNSLFSIGGGGNAWTNYFEPVSDLSLETVAQASSTFPPEWTREAICRDDYSDVRPSRPQSTYGLSLLSRSEATVVSDTFVHASDLVHWCEPSDPCFGKSALEAERMIARKYLRPTVRLRERIQRFREARGLCRGRWLAVHFRDADKGGEFKGLGEVNSQYMPRLEAQLASDSGLSLFVLTDSVQFCREVFRRFPGRAVAADALRAAGSIGVHLSGHDPIRVATEVLVDAFVAAECDEFLGNGASNVSLAVGMLKDWAVGTYTLLGPDWREGAFGLPK